MSPPRLHLVVAAMLLAGALHAQVPQLIHYQGRVSVGNPPVNFEGTGSFKFALLNAQLPNQNQTATATPVIMGGFGDGLGQRVTAINVTNGGSGYLVAPAVTIFHHTGSGAAATANIVGGVVTSITVTAMGQQYGFGTTVTIDPPPSNFVPSTSYWSNDGTSVAGSEPVTAISLPVTKGLYSVLLGANMTPVPASVFNNPDVRLRVWFDDGTANGSQLLSPDQRIAAVGYAMIAGNVSDGAITSAKIAAAAVGSSQLAANAVQVNHIAAGAVGNSQLAANAVQANHISAGAVGAGQLAGGAAAANLNAGGQSGVATGGIVLSATENNPALLNAGYVKIGSTTTTDTWREYETGDPPPVARNLHSAVWTGSEMIVWGGNGAVPLADGSRYDPATNAWTTISSTSAPAARHSHTAIWTGSEMVLWGGNAFGVNLNSGGRYNPVTNSWVATNTSGAPTGRIEHKAVWTGTEMLIWGGYSVGPQGTGGRYNPGTNSWQGISNVNAPSARQLHTAVWTGSEMWVWGGTGTSSLLGDGGRYNPVDNEWTAINPTGAPTARSYHTAVWTGDEMIVWGGDAGAFGDPPTPGSGARFNPGTNTWSQVTLTNAPLRRINHSAVWTGGEMIIWGGGGDGGISQVNGSRYDPATDSWANVSTTAAPGARSSTTAVWTGSEMIVWGGYNGGPINTGGRYNPLADTWKSTSTSSGPSARANHTAIWTGSEMIVWGGYNGSYLNTGGRFDPALNSWSAISTAAAPAARYGHTAIWTGSKMVVWGGYDTVTGNVVNTGGRYDPALNSWSSVTTSAAPAARRSHTAIWAGSEMIVWGGDVVLAGTVQGRLNSGGRYNPSSDSWTAVTTSGAPTARESHTAVWTGSAMIIWGGEDNILLADGGRYNPSSNSWSSVSTAYPVPAARESHTAIWTGTEMIVWGGRVNGFDYASSGGRYNPGSNTWASLNTTGAPKERIAHTAVWTGSEMVIWGGQGDIDVSYGSVGDGARYNPMTNQWTDGLITNNPLARSYHTAIWTGSEMIVWGGFNDITRLNENLSYTPGRTLYLYQRP